MFNLRSDYLPTKAQTKAVEEIVSSINAGNKHQTLLGVTGSGKTFVTANVINKIQKPTLIISHNKTLAGQLYQEFRDFFPENAVEYFVSYYDYYQPESYMPATDTYIEKDADINEEIDRLRLSATASLITRKDVIVVASVSCIYNLGSPIEYQKQIIELKVGMKLRIDDLQKRLIQLYYERSDIDFKRGSYRGRGDTIDIHPSYQNFATRIEFLGEKITSIKHFDPVTGKILKENELKDQETLSKAGEDYLKRNSIIDKDFIIIYPAKHYVAPKDNFEKAIDEIKYDLKNQVEALEKVGKKIEAYRLSQRTNYDLEMIQEIGYCKGIENYSRYFDGRSAGSAPYSLLDFFPKEFALFIDESHITIPQIRGMFNGDQARKQTLIDYGFRLPSALDNRPLRFDEFERRMGTTVYTSATPGPWELSKSNGSPFSGAAPLVELLVRPTGLIDPEITILPSQGQIQDLENRIKEKIQKKGRVLVTTLTKRMAEELSDYLLGKGLKVAYLHSDIVTLERSDILDNLRKGEFDVLVGINLLREGLDLPEVSLVAILDADKEGFLRSDTSLIQTMGRAARHIQGEVVMYADKTTDSMKRAINEVARRRKIQMQYNSENNIVPSSISKPIRERIMEKPILEDESKSSKIDLLNIEQYNFNTSSMPKQKAIIKSLEQKMKSAAELLEFELAAQIRDKIRELKKK